MFREMRKKERQMTEEEATKALEKGSNGVLSVIGDDGHPYGVPLSYSYKEGKIYFHCAITGHKLDAIKNDERVSFTVVTKDDVVAENFTTNFESVIAFGRAKIIKDEGKIVPAKMHIADKYSKGYEKEAMDHIRSAMGRFYIVEIEIDHMTGKKR